MLAAPSLITFQKLRFFVCGAGGADAAGAAEAEDATASCTEEAGVD